jgi:ADP-heptose:LPS heptosyltransferase
MIKNKEHIRKILLIKLKGIGDVVLSTVVLNNLQKDFPNASIDFLTEPPSKAALEYIPAIREILLFDKKEPFNSMKLIWRVMKRQYDLVIDMYSNPRTALVTYLSGARYRAGFPYRGREYAYNLKGPVDRGTYHAAQLHLELLREIGLTANDATLHFGISQNDSTFADAFFKEAFPDGKPVIALSPSGGWESKKCDVSKFVEIGKAIFEKYKCKLLVVWGPSDLKDAQDICAGISTDVVLAPPSSIREMAALMKKCKFVVANDSGPMHIATAVQVPVLSLHGPTNPKLQGPFGDMHEYIRLESLDCICCNLLVCPRKHECFTELPVKDVMKKVECIVEKNNLVLT